MTGVIDAAIGRSRTVLASLVLVLIAGTIAFLEIPKESSPDVPIPIIYVAMSHRGISPEDAERLLVRPMEQELKGIEGVKEMRSTAYEGGANVLMEFEAGFDSEKAKRDVQEKVDIAKAELPDETDEPTVNEVNISLFPIVVITLAGDIQERALLRIADDLSDELEKIPSVLEVDIGGDREEQADIIVDPVRLQSYGLANADVAEVIARFNRLVAAGTLDTGQGRFAIKVPGLYKDLDDILDQPVKYTEDSVVRLRDFATIRASYKDPEGFARVNGQPAVTLEVKKRVGENIIDTVNAARAVVERERALWPDGLEVNFIQDQSDDIQTMLFDLQNNVIAAILLVMVVVVAALGLRSGLLVGVAIPGSFLMAILLLAAMGLTVNMVVLFSLILAVGMLVDGAIVVTEYADRKMAEGLDRRTAYSLAAQRMAWPVIASTATTLAAFMPLLFWTGTVGEFMKYMPITLVATLTASLLMALIFVPTLGALFGKAGAADPETMRALAASERGDLTDLKGMTGAYARLLNASLRQPGLIVILAVVGLVASWMAYAHFGRGVEFFPDVEPEQAQVLVHARGNLSVHEKDALVREVEERVLALPDFDAVYARSFNRAPRDAAEDVIGVIGLTYKDWQMRRPSDEVLDLIRARTSDLAGVRVEPKEPDPGPPVGKEIQVQLTARDPAILPDAVATVLEAFDDIGGLVDIEDSRPIPGIQWDLDVDMGQAAKLGGDVASVGNIVQLVTSGLKVSSFRPDSAKDEVDIVVRYPTEYRSLSQLDRLRLNTPRGLVPVSSFVTREANPKISQIERVDGRRVMTVEANVAKGLLPNDKMKELRAWMAEHPERFPQGLEIDFKGEDEEQKESQAFLSKAFAVALFIMALILVTQFNSFYAAFLILSAVVMSTVGVMLGLLVTGQAFGIIMSGVGVIALAGIVVNNNIVLIDTHDRLKMEFDDPREAILRTGVQRLRPVMLTSVTTMLGLLPMMFMVNIDFIGRTVSYGAPSMQWWTQLATAVVVGLLFATVLTLVVTPSALMLQARAHAWVERRRARRRARIEAPHTGTRGGTTSPPADDGPDSDESGDGPRNGGDDGSPDGGPRDGGPRDGGPRDGGPRDGGPRDGGDRTDEDRPDRPDVPHAAQFTWRPA
ncbi:efflux RND transporter permease subunit [Roseospira marina]|uniref:efflux RND transporter permease subunit n=1 Tax=Roseospira marina TaxID=140057 RepID=UPI0017F2F768|nr:efflux RND transporter permease subunit [Roseospira marina]MBB4313789.1 multidrug efflux pump [Roseospira marina]MBB5086951.1 multidrug efflux pump [Roseospira marina]